MEGERGGGELGLLILLVCQAMAPQLAQQLPAVATRACRRILFFKGSAGSRTLCEIFGHSSNRSQECVPQLASQLA